MYLINRFGKQSYPHVVRCLIQLQLVFATPTPEVGVENLPHFVEDNITTSQTGSSYLQFTRDDNTAGIIFDSIIDTIEMLHI